MSDYDDMYPSGAADNRGKGALQTSLFVRLRSKWGGGKAGKVAWDAIRLLDPSHKDHDDGRKRLGTLSPKERGDLSTALQRVAEGRYHFAPIASSVLLELGRLDGRTQEVTGEESVAAPARSPYDLSLLPAALAEQDASREFALVDGEILSPEAASDDARRAYEVTLLREGVPGPVAARLALERHPKTF